MQHATQQEQARIENIATQVGQAHGYENISVELEDFSAFKVRWTRSVKTIKFTVSDYLCGAPDYVVADVLNVIFRRIEGETSSYSEETCAFFTDKHFSGARRRTFNARNDIEPAKFKTFKGVPVHYYKHPSIKAGGASTLMRVIAINPLLKGESEEVLDNVIRHQYNVLQSGLATFGKEPKQVECNEEVIRNYSL